MIRNKAPDEARTTRINEVKDIFVAIEAVLVKDIPANRERSLTLTNLEQASMWATKAILEA